MEIRQFALKRAPENDMNVSLVREKTIHYTGLKLIQPSQAYEFFRNYIQLCDCAEEYVYMLAMDSKNKPLGIFEVSHGTVNTSIMPTREILVRALSCASVNIILAHNHPSGDPSPSAEDIRVTKRLSEACTLIGINLVDHIVVGDERYISLKEQGLF